jgi:hypothetical protein
MNGAYTFVPPSEGSYYFACTVGSHCDSGQKFTLTVADEVEDDEDECVDSSAAAFCSRKVAAGDCIMASVLQKCAKSCGACGDAEEEDDDVDDECVDSSAAAFCARKVAAGDCTQASVLEKCAKSCGACGNAEEEEDDEDECVDSSAAAFCSRKVAAGDCTNAYVLEKCAKSCGACGDALEEEDDEDDGGEECVDSLAAAFCARKVAAGDCTQASVLEKCAKSCGAC